MLWMEFLILIGVWVGVWLEWQSLQEKRKTKIRRIVTMTLKKLKENFHASQVR